MLLSSVSTYAADRIVFVGHWSESDSFFNVIRNSAQLAADQLGVKIEFRNPSGGDLSFITHNVRHAMAIGDRFTVLNHGKTLGTAVRGEVEHEELQNLMAGGQELVELESSLRGRV